MDIRAWTFKIERRSSEDTASIFENSKICIPRYMNQSWQRKSYNDLSLQKVQLHIFQQGADVLGQFAFYTIPA